MAKVGIAFNANALFKWVEWILNYSARKMKKSLTQQRTRFLNGLPHSFTDAIMHEKLSGPNGTVVFGLIYPAHHPKAGQNRPADQAGKPDLLGLAHKYYPEWARRIRVGMIKAVPKGSVYQATMDDESGDETAVNDNDPDGESVHAARSTGKPSNVTASSVCTACGGIGHWAVTNGIECLTRKFQTAVSKETLKQIRYPNGLHYPDFDRTKGKQIADRVDDSRKSPRPRRFPAKPVKNKGVRKSAKQVEVAPEPYFSSNDPGPSTELETESQVHQTQDSSDSDDGADHNVQLAVDFGAIMITPPPSPPEMAQKECLACSDP